MQSDSPIRPDIQTQCLAKGSWDALYVSSEYLEVVYDMSENRLGILRIRSWHFSFSFVIFIFYISAPIWYARWINLFCPGIHPQCLAKRTQDTLHASPQHLEVENCKSEKSQNADIYRIWCFFQLCKIPHQSGPNCQESADTSSKEVL